MNYAEMSDFEINKAVFLKLKTDYEDFNFNPFPGNCTSFSYGDGANWHEFDACNNPSDAWPIIDDILSTLVSTEKYDDGIGFGEREMTIWQAQMHKNNCGELRAAMIVFLMMNEGK